MSASVVPILLPQAGNSMEEGTIVAWKVKPGDRVKVGQVLYELETDKATIEVEAEVEGRLSRIVIGDGQTAPVKTPVAYLSEDDAAVAALVGGGPLPPSPPPQRETFGEGGAGTQSLEAQRSMDPGDLLAPSRKRVSPVARKAAADLGVNCDTLAGSGPDGRVLLEDVVTASKAKPTAPAPVSTPAAIRANAGGSRTPMSKMRRAIGKNLSVSKQTLPHWYLKLSIDAEPLLAHYRREKALYPCSLNDVIVLAVSRALVEFPIFRCQIDGDDLVQFDSANIGIAVGMDEGLVVPVLRGADRMNLKGIAFESKRLVESARAGKIEGIGEGVFTISNLGMFGVEEFVAIVNPPESGILAVGAAREEPIVRDGALRMGKKMTLVLSADHRLIDGTTGAKFMARLKELLENPAAIGGA